MTGILLRSIGAIVALLMVFGAFPASAALIIGDISMSGDFAPTGGTNLSDATGIDFLGDDFTVNGANGDFAGLAGMTGSIQDFQFNPLAPSPVDPLWSVGGFTFALDAISIDFQNESFLLLSGTGVIAGAGFDDTSGIWNLSGNSAGALFNFSAGSTFVPVPGSLLLFGSALGFAGWLRRRLN